MALISSKHLHKPKLSRSKAAGLALLTLSAFAGGASVARLGHASGDDDPYALLSQLARVLVLIENDYVDPVDRDRLLTGAIKGMVAELDPHSSYLPARDFKVLQDDTRGQFAGIGVEVDFRNDRVTVISPIDGSPAQRAGIRPGDVIVSIDGQAVDGKNAGDLVKLMRGAPGTSVRVAVRRTGGDGLLTFTLLRRVIEVSSVLGADLEGDIAYLRIKQFQSKTHSEFLDAVGDLRGRMNRIGGVILDMRNNPGGLVIAASAVADEFLNGGTLYSTRHRGKVLDEVSASSSGALQEGPVVVLVNECAPGSRPRDHRRRTHLRQRLGAIHHRLARWRRPAAHHHALLHARRARDSGGRDYPRRVGGHGVGGRQYHHPAGTRSGEPFAAGGRSAQQRRGHSDRSEDGGSRRAECRQRRGRAGAHAPRCRAQRAC
jgi:C-terminal peptidase prc